MRRCLRMITRPTIINRTTWNRTSPLPSERRRKRRLRWEIRVYIRCSECSKLWMVEIDLGVFHTICTASIKYSKRKEIVVILNRCFAASAAVGAAKAERTSSQSIHANSCCQTARKPSRKRKYSLILRRVKIDDLIV